MTNDTTDQRSAQDAAQRRDELLRRLLKTPPQPRPKRERKKFKHKKVSKRKS